MAWPCNSIRCRSASVCSQDSNSQPAMPQWRGRLWQLVSCTSRFPFEIGSLQCLQGYGISSNRSRTTRSTWGLNGLSLQNGHSLMRATCSSHKSFPHRLHDTEFVSTWKQIGHSNTRAGRLIDSAHYPLKTAKQSMPVQDGHLINFLTNEDRHAGQEIEEIVIFDSTYWR